MKAVFRGVLFFMTVVIFSVNTIVYAKDKVSDYKRKNIETQSVDAKIADTLITGEIPRFIGQSGFAFEKELNNRITQAYNNELKNITESTISLDFSFDVKIDGNNDELVSILLFSCATASSSINKVISFNYNTLTEKMINITNGSVLGPNGIKLANKFILSEIKANPARFNSNFSGISEKQNFAVENDTVIIYFNEFEIAPGSEGIVEFAIPKSGIINCYVSKNEYYTPKNNAYNLKMIELRKVAQEFGYVLTWNSSENKAYIYRNRQLLSSVKIGANEYYKGRLAKRSLEAAPEIYKDRTYVPISFFEEILDQYYSVDSNGTITFSEYVPK